MKERTITKEEKLLCLEPNPQIQPPIFYSTQFLERKVNIIEGPHIEIETEKKMLTQSIGKKFNLKLKIKEYDPTKKKLKDEKYKSKFRLY